jgi:hypothetical protein
MCGIGKTLILDLANLAAIKDDFFKAAAEGEKFDGIANRAGIPCISPLKSSEKAIKVYELNSYATLELSKVFINRNVFNHVYGSIVFKLSVYGVVGSAANVSYAMSNPIINLLTKAIGSKKYQG